MGSSLELPNFPSGSNRKTPKHCDARRSEQVTPRNACTPTENMITGLELVELVAIHKQMGAVMMPLLMKTTRRGGPANSSDLLLC